MKKTEIVIFNNKYTITEKEAYKAFLRLKPYNSKTMKPYIWEEFNNYQKKGEINENK